MTIKKHQKLIKAIENTKKKLEFDKKNKKIYRKIGILVLEYIKKYPNDQDLGRHIRDIKI